MVEQESGEQERVVLGKCARALAEEIAGDLANPLNREAKAMLQVMADTNEARKRVVTLHGRLEAELGQQVNEAVRHMVLGLVGCVAAGLVYWYLSSLDSEDTREL